VYVCAKRGTIVGVMGYGRDATSDIIFEVRTHGLTVHMTLVPLARVSIPSSTDPVAVREDHHGASVY
jgi:hypothetical protein